MCTYTHGKIVILVIRGLLANKMSAFSSHEYVGIKIIDFNKL